MGQLDAAADIRAWPSFGGTFAGPYETYSAAQGSDNYTLVKLLAAAVRLQNNARISARE
jgi:hypothetical protein